MTERMVTVDGVTLCIEPFGDPADPAVLLVMGLGASMLWWDDELCRRLAEGRRFVVRYDHRDTGRSSTDVPGHPTYTGADLVADARRVLDGAGIAAAHVVGVSAGAGCAQLLAADHPERVRSLVLISSSPVTSGDVRLPPPTDRFTRFVTTVTVDWTDHASVVEYLVAYARVLHGDERPFDEAAVLDLVRRDVERATDVAALQNHDLLAHDGSDHPSASAIAAPTLVIHGSADPMFPVEHGVALTRSIPGATLLVLDGAGHGIDPADRDAVVDAVLAHTSG